MTASAPLNRTRKLNRRKKILFRLLACSVASLVTVLLAEFALSLAGIGYPALYSPDEFCGSRLRPNTSGWWITEGRTHIHINSHGIRGEETRLKKRDNVFRIAVLGDWELTSPRSASDDCSSGGSDFPTVEWVTLRNFARIGRTQRLLLGLHARKKLAFLKHDSRFEFVFCFDHGQGNQQST